MSRLEHFIRDHRDEFDDEQPSPQVWADLQKDLGLAPAVNKSKVVTMKILRWSVAAAILVLAGFGVFHLINNKSRDPQLAMISCRRSIQPMQAKCIISPASLN